MKQRAVDVNNKFEIIIFLLSAHDFKTLDFPQTLKHVIHATENKTSL